MRTLYACQVELQDEGRQRGLAATYAGGLQTVWDWCTRRLVDPPDPGDFSEGSYRQEASGILLQWRTERDPDAASLRACEFLLAHPHVDDQSIQVRVTVVVTCDGAGVRVSVRLSLASSVDKVAPLRVQVEPPGLMRMLAQQFRVEADGRRLYDAAHEVLAGNVDGLLALLCDSDRRLPVLCVTTDTSTGQPVIDADRLAAQLVGLAHVRILATHLAVLRLSEELGRELSVWRGSARLYWPGFERDGDGRGHRFWPVADVRARPVRVAEDISRWIQRTAVARMGPDPLLTDLRMASQRRLQEQLRTARERGEVSDEWLQDFENVLIAKDALDDAYRELQAEYDALESENQAMRRAMAQMNMPVPASDDDLQPTEEPEPFVPASILAAVQEAERRFGDELVFLPSASESAAESPYGSPEVVFEALEVIAEAARRWRADELDGGFKLFFESHGWELKNMSKPTVGRWPTEYERIYNGRKITLGPHIGRGVKNPTQHFRIYWYQDDEDRALVIGHCGRHLTDTGS